METQKNGRLLAVLLLLVATTAGVTVFAAEEKEQKRSLEAQDSAAGVKTPEKADPQNLKEPEKAKEEKAAPKKHAGKDKNGAKNEKKSEAEEQLTEHVLDAEIADQLRETAPDLLRIRDESDKLYTQYRTLALGKGMSLARDAEKMLPGIRKDIEKCLDKLTREYEKHAKPAEKLQAQLQEEEEKVLEKLDRLGEHGKRSEKLDTEADEIAAKLKELEETVGALKTAGMPSYTLGNTDILFVEHLLRLSEQQMRSLKSLEQKHPDYLKGRIYLEHLRADVAAAKKVGSRGREEKAQRKFSAAARKFTALHESMLEQYQGVAEDLQETQDKLMPKIERTMGKRSGRKYQEQLSALEGKIDSVNDILRFMSLCGKGIITPVEKKEKDLKGAGAKPEDD